jgi:putative transposase
MIVDSQSAKSSDCGEERGYDGGKHVSGRKRNLVVDTLGFVVLTKVTTANVQDVHAGKKLLCELSHRLDLLSRLKTIFADSGYRGELVDSEAFIYVAMIRLGLRWLAR